MEFASTFKSLTGYEPFPWQRALYTRFVAGDFPDACDLPTGLGKTSVIPIWLIALATAPQRVPRRLVYVVNRRTVVDQASVEAMTTRTNIELLPELKTRLTDLCAAAHDSPLAISTLRGQLADNGEWSADPSRPAIIVGTVDMIGSRLLFSGYGRGFKSRPLHAGFLAQDVLLIHDEAHLEPAFQELLTAIAREQKRCREFRCFKVMELSATSRGGGEPFRLSDKDHANAVVQKRIHATKRITLHEEADEKIAAERIAAIALEHQNSGRAILIFTRTVHDLGIVADRLKKHPVQCLTGTLRGLERDRLAREDAIFARFLPKPLVKVHEGTVYLLCTSAGEVGVNISADHLVCDLTPFDSMAQRFGRVNRFGDCSDTRIDVVHPTEFDDTKPFEVRRRRTLGLLRQLNGDGSPAALAGLDALARREAFTPDPVIVPSSDILFDAWAMTTITEPLPGRPPVADFLHGVAEWEPPQTQVAWRREVELISAALPENYSPQTLLDSYPLKPHELLRDRSDRVFKQLAQWVTGGKANAPAWLINDDGSVEIATLSQIVEGGKESIEGKTLLLTPSAGGLEAGMLKGSAPYDPSRDDYDVADRWIDLNNNPLRLRVEANTADVATPPKGMRLILQIPLQTRADDAEDAEASGRVWNWFVRTSVGDDDGSKSAAISQALTPHLELAHTYAKSFSEKLGLSPSQARAVSLAAKWHDLGKNRSVWQNSIGNRDYPATILAKSGGRMRPLDLNAYRHEFGSLTDLMDDTEFAKESDEVRELVLHLVAAHHGRARPHFPEAEVLDPKHPQAQTQVIARDIPRRFDRLQRQYGRWGLAWLESLVRAADILASQSGKEASR